MELGYGARDVVLAGDSAGGNLALELVLSLKKAGRRLPGKLVLYSPWTDLSCSGASYSEHEQDDPILTRTYLESVRQAYAPQGDWEQPELSPLFADLSEFPPTLIQYGGHEPAKKEPGSGRRTQCASVLAQYVARVPHVPASPSATSYGASRSVCTNILTRRRLP